jgi:hypothetical protein
MGTVDEPEPGEELLIYAGARLQRDGQLVDAWVDQHGTVLLYDPYPEPGPVIGARYQALVSRDGGQVLLHQRPTFLGRNAVDGDQRTEWAVHDITARACQSAARRERTAARRDDLDTLLAPLRKLAATLANRADREAFLAQVLTRILRP